MSDRNRFDPQRSATYDAAVAAVLDGSPAHRSELARSFLPLFDAVTPFDVLGLPRFQQDDVDAIRRFADEAGKLVHLFHRGLSAYAWDREVHPALMLLRRENAAIIAAAVALGPLYGRIGDPAVRVEVRTLLQRFRTIERKLAKAELLLHPALERHLPSPVPLKVLWQVHDDIRSILPTFLAALDGDGEGLDVLAGRFHALVVGLCEKEELLLYPVAAGVLSPAEWDGIGREAPAFGEAFGADPVAIARETRHPEGAYVGHTGTLGFDQLAAIFASLPLELTFTDAAGIVRWYSETAAKIFARTPQILGRPVVNCHPPKSVPIVRRLLQAFADGSQTRAELWTEIHGRFVQIVYVALRDPSGTFLGTLEIVQDATHLRSLAGTQETIGF